MDWAAWNTPVDGYCERLAPGLLAEPLNLVTNLAFLVAALVMWPRTRGIGRVLCVILFVIGVGSGLFHSVATPWASAGDIAPIVLFILVYVFAASRDFLGMGTPGALAMVVLFVPYAAATLPVFRLIPGIGSSAAYAPVPLLILLYAAWLMPRAPATAGRLVGGAVLLSVSITFRALDEPLCGVWPWGTHFVWHVLNAVMLAWMIEVWTRHVAPAGKPALEGGARRR